MRSSHQLLVAAVAAAAATASSTPLDDYLEKADPHYGWNKTGEIKTVFGGTGHVLNVTSQQWLDTTKAYVYGPMTAIWTHTVVVIVPKTLTMTNVAISYLTGNCNEKVPAASKTDEELLMVDEISHATGSIGIIVYQIPNCPMVYPADPIQKHRSEDDMIGFAWLEFLRNPNGPGAAEWLPRLPMAKAGMQAMRAAEEFTKSIKVTTETPGWLVGGASKRGWTTWMVGSATCSSCPTIAGLFPLVPIVPDLQKEMHRQFRSYGGWTFAFQPYTVLNITQYLDSPAMDALVKIVDPSAYYDRLERLPKLVCLSSDDEFMQFDWSDIWYDELKGEKHLLIAPNSEHSLSTGFPEVVKSASYMLWSIAKGKTQADRPSFTYTKDASTGALTVTITNGAIDKVILRHAETLQSDRRDFRWVRLASESNGNCSLPDIKMPKPLFGGNCLQPIVWKSLELSPDSSGKVYVATPPTPKHKGHWTGYYVELYFKSDTGHEAELLETTPGFAFPDTLPFADCTLAGCKGHLL